MSKRIKILTPRIYEHSDFFHNAYDFARKESLNTNELCLELSHYLVEHFDEVWKIERPRIYKQICDLQSQLQQANEIINNPDTLIFQQQQLIDNLKSQLAEKDKEITQRLVIQEKDYNQDKISFALEQLEKVKETTECVLDNALKNSSLNQSYYDRLLDEIDNQINELKEMR